MARGVRALDAHVVIEIGERRPLVVDDQNIELSRGAVHIQDRSRPRELAVAQSISQAMANPTVVFLGWPSSAG